MKKKSSSKWKSMSDEQKLVEVKTVISHISNGINMPAAKFFDDNRPKWMPGSWAIANRGGGGEVVECCVIVQFDTRKTRK